MVIPKHRLVIGLTGSIGSGCSTLGLTLQKMGFTVFCLSNIVKKEWEIRNKKKKAEKDARKFELQDIGNELRETHGDGYLASETIKQAKKKTEEQTDLVFDSIRHTGEIEALRNEYSEFVLIATDCPIMERWERVRPTYISLGLDRDHFESDDSRDKNEAENPHGQQVELCVYEADIAVDNERRFDKSIVVTKLENKMTPYIDLVRGVELRHPTPKEEYMSIAYTTSLMSKCYKRQVGAVIVDEKNDRILSAGYNKNPSPSKSCIDEYTKCNRDKYRQEYFEKLREAGILCPNCKNPIKKVSTTYKCECSFDLEKFFLPDRAVSQCTALHAEQKALMSLGGRNVNGATLYSTTFPCSKCANDIVEAQLGRVVYVSAYPDRLAAKVFMEAGIPTERFEGVKARAYFKLFGSWRKETEDNFLREMV